LSGPISLLRDADEMPKLSQRILLTLLCGAILYGCGPSGPPQETSKRGAILAKVDGQTVLADDVRLSIDMLPDAPRISLTHDKEALRRYVEEYAHKEMIYREALKKGIDKDPEVRRLVAAAEKTYIVQRMLDTTLADKAKVTDADLKKYFEEHKDEFTAEDRLTLAHIQFDNLKAAEEARSRLKRGEDFAALARALSTDALSRDKGGLLGTVERSKAPPEFSEALADMKKGDVSAPVKTRHGYHLVKLMDVEPGKLVAFEGVREPLRQFLAQEKQRKALEDYIASLKKDYKVELNTAEIDRFVQATATPKK
jgi:peptidyl-prolyl cis-trans isomerase C